MNCPKCKITMKPGLAILQTYTSGMPDFIGEDRGITWSPGGPGKLVWCSKCPKCGFSRTEPDPDYGPVRGLDTK